MNMIPFHARAESVNNTLELVLDTQGRLHVGYYIRSGDTASHTIEVSYDNQQYYEFKKIDFSQAGEQSIIGVEEIPWRYVKLKTTTIGNHQYELIVK